MIEAICYEINFISSNKCYLVSRYADDNGTNPHTPAAGGVARTSHVKNMLLDYIPNEWVNYSKCLVYFQNIKLGSISGERTNVVPHIRFPRERERQDRTTTPFDVIHFLIITFPGRDFCTDWRVHVTKSEWCCGCNANASQIIYCVSFR